MREGIFTVGAWPERHFARSRDGRWGQASGVAVLTACLVWPLWRIAAAAVERMTGPSRVAAVLLMVLYGVSWVAVMAYGTARPPRDRVLLTGWLLALGAAIAVLRGDWTSLGHLAFALMAAVWLLPVRWGVLVAAAVLTVRLGAQAVTGGSAPWGTAADFGLQILGSVSLILVIRLLVQLGQAREEIEALAAAAERARLARDLHDVLGHTLTAIGVKTGLARRLLESGADQQAAVTELRDVERLSREAHAEIRATVSGRRRPSLVAELAGARAALRAAGIGVTLPRDVAGVPEDLVEPFSYALREAVTNVIRHSGATRCEVRVGGTWLEVRDDGGSAARSAPPGNGLAGLAERLGAAGATVEAGPLPSGGFLLRASRA
ncbi:sensor histidine kinase [Microbispora sp. NPDC049125]|uniref:sensor histidine kinase n=1 Tax=Microbispora sp. NPDC049125 TaxID=3154929 RepID=UPI0034663F9D